MMYGPQAALIAECFPTRLRYSGSSLGFHLSSVIAGGPAPLIATALFAATRSGYAVAGYIAFCAIVSILQRYFCLISPIAISRRNTTKRGPTSAPAAASS